MTYQMQIEQLKEQGLYGTVGDPYWNREKKMHTCCGATRPYYHRKDCPLCAGRLKPKTEEPKHNTNMQWSNLKQNKCPQCNTDLVKSMVPAGPGYIACKCGFRISEQKYKEITSDRVIRDLDYEPDTGEAEA